MKRRHHSPKWIARKLREADGLVGEGASLVQVCKHLAVTEATHHWWHNQYWGIEADDAKRLKGFERVNAGLRRLVVEQALNIDMLKEVNRGNFRARFAAG